MNDQTVNSTSTNHQPGDGSLSLAAILDAIDGYAETPTSTLIQAALERAQQSSTMTAIAGVPGAGKTTTCKRYMAMHDHVWRCQFSTDTKSPCAVLSEIADAVGVYTASNNPREIREMIVSRIVRYRGLLICDEAQHLTRIGLETIRSVFDRLSDTRGPIGVAFVGHVDLMEKIAKLDQLFGRISAPLRISQPAPGDIDAILAQCGVTDKRVRNFLRQHATHSTGLRRVVASLRNAVAYAAVDGLAVKEAHVRQAWDELSGAVAK